MLLFCRSYYTIVFLSLLNQKRSCKKAMLTTDSQISSKLFIQKRSKLTHISREVFLIKSILELFKILLRGIKLLKHFLFSHMFLRIWKKSEIQLFLLFQPTQEAFPQFFISFDVLEAIRGNLYCLVGRIVCNSKEKRRQLFVYRIK